MVALSTTNIRWSELYCFYPLLTLILGMSTFCNYKITKFNYKIAITKLQNSAITACNTNKTSTLMLCLLQLKTKAFLWMYNRSVQFIFQLAPNLLSGVEVRTLRGPVHNFQCSSRFLPSQVVPAIVYFMGIVMTNSTKTTETSWLCQVF